MPVSTIKRSVPASSCQAADTVSHQTLGRTILEPVRWLLRSEMLQSITDTLFWNISEFPAMLLIPGVLNHRSTSQWKIFENEILLSLLLTKNIIGSCYYIARLLHTAAFNVPPYLGY